MLKFDIDLTKVPQHVLWIIWNKCESADYGNPAYKSCMSEVRKRIDAGTWQDDKCETDSAWLKHTGLI